VANGEPFMLSPAPGEPPQLIHPTMSDVLTAATVLARKVLPDLKSVAVDGAAGVPVAVMIRIGTDAGD
jgi:hypothetical protein